MSRNIINQICGRMSLRAPQEESLQALDKAIQLVPDMLYSKRLMPEVLKVLHSEFPSLTDFEREFPSLCFALATGVGKTRLMGAFITYLHLEHGINNFFVLAPNLTIYNKLITDFTRNTPKYVFKGISEFAQQTPLVITGDNYDQSGAVIADQPRGFAHDVRINIFNIAKINSEVRGGKEPRIKRMQEVLGDSYFNHLANLPDLVLLMDESHRYRASAGIRAINELKPLFGLELTATPYTESSKGPVPFKNVVVDYPLARAMDDGFVKIPYAVTQENYEAKQHTPEEVEKTKLEDGIRLHEITKVELETYARTYDVKQVKPFMLVIARDTTHAAQLLELMESDKFFKGRYKGKVIQVDSSKSGAEEEEMITRLLAVESFDEPTEVVIHVNMLKEGWDVTNLYTIVPLRAANARTLIEQSIGRGLRLPYGKRTGVDVVDALNIIAHDKFQEVVDEANNPDNPLRLRVRKLSQDLAADATESVQVISNLETKITGAITSGSSGTQFSTTNNAKSVFAGAGELEIAKVTMEVISQLQHNPQVAPTSLSLLTPQVQAQVVAAVQEKLTGGQRSLLEADEKINLEAVVKQTSALVVDETIDIPRILVVPKGEVTYGYKAFKLDLGKFNLQHSEQGILKQNLKTNEQSTITAQVGIREKRPEDYIVRALIDYDDISYDEHADLLYDLSGQVVAHLKTYLTDDQSISVLDGNSRRIADTVHAQMDQHFWENSSGYDVEVRSGFVPIKKPSFSVPAGQQPLSIRDTLSETGKIKQMIFGGFTKCLFPVQKFDSDTERRFAIILERDAIKWFKPVQGQFKIEYKIGRDISEYVPDFVVELKDYILMCETKARSDLDAPDVIAKAAAAKKWCEHASDYSKKNNGKPWLYLLIPHDEVKENYSIRQFMNIFERA